MGSCKDSQFHVSTSPLFVCVRGNRSYKFHRCHHAVAGWKTNYAKTSTRDIFTFQCLRIGFKITERNFQGQDPEFEVVVIEFDQDICDSNQYDWVDCCSIVQSHNGRG